MKANAVVPSSADGSGYAAAEAESRLTFRSIPTQMNGMAKANRIAESNNDTHIDLTQENPNLARNLDVQYANRSGQLSRVTLFIITNDLYRACSIFAVITALFAYDFSRTMAYSAFDEVVEGILIFIFVFLTCDLIFQCVVYKSYPFSFFFWLDLVGTITLLADISFTYEAFGYTQADLTVARGGRAGRAAARMGRISRMVMWVRITRLIKLARVFRQFRLAIQNKFSSQSRRKSKTRASVIIRRDSQPKRKTSSSTESTDILAAAVASHNSEDAVNNDVVSSEDDSSMEDRVANAHSSKIGVVVADAVTRNVVFGILLTVCLVPFFSSTEQETYSAYYLALDLFNTQYSSASTAMNATINTFLSTREGANVYYLKIGDTEYRNIANLNLRATELIEFMEDNTFIKVDNADLTRFQHGMAIGFTLLIVFLFAFMAFIISRNITKLVVHPIEKMTKIVQEFTKNICILGGDLDNQHQIVSQLLETDVIEAAITRLSSIFTPLLNPKGHEKKSASATHKKQDLESVSELTEDIDPSDSSLSSADKSKENYNRKQSFVAPVKTKTALTTIRSRDSVVSIQISQKRNILIEERVIQQRTNALSKSGDLDSFYIDKRAVPEFSSLNTVMSHPIASQYFKVYCIEHMLTESFLFLQAVGEFHESVREAFLKVYNAHINERAFQRINILDKEAKKMYDDFKNDDFGIRIFDTLRRETVATLSAESFNTFLQSKYAHTYVKYRDEDKLLCQKQKTMQR